jgi:hypothetical protein
MSEEISPSPVPATPAPGVVFRMLTPVFKYAIEGATCFMHSGNYRSARFEIKLRPYTHNPTDWAEVTEYADDGIRDLLIQRRFHVPEALFGVARHVLLNDALHRTGSIMEDGGNMLECLEIQDAVVSGLRLHSSAGLHCHESYSFRYPPTQHSGLIIHSPKTRQAMFSHLGTPSVLRVTDFDACRSTIDKLLSKTWNEKITSDKVLRLAMEYQRLSFTLERVEHAFLILMVAFEAMFKKDGTESASKPAQRIGRLLGAATKKDCNAIQKEFNDDPDSFSKIRNQIAHGDPTLDLATVANKYPCLYRYITAAIVTLLNLPAGSLDDTKDYYDEISCLTASRFVNLPNT